MYTIGDPLSAKTKYPWRLDDEKLVYPFYEKAVKAGIRTICVHKGLMPVDYEKSWAGVWQYNTPGTLAKPPKTGHRSTSSSTTAVCAPSRNYPMLSWPEFDRERRHRVGQ